MQPAAPERRRIGGRPATKDDAAGYSVAQAIDRRIRQPGYAMEGDPYLERHRMTVEGEIMVTVCVRVRSVLREGDWNMAVVPPDGTVGAVP